MNILFLNTNIGYGGASKIIVWVANQCVLNGHKVTFLTYRDNKIYQYVNPKIRLIHKQLESTKNSVLSLQTVFWIHNFIIKNKFDIGIAFLSPSILRLALAAKGTSIKVLFSHRSDPFYSSGDLSLRSKIIRILNEWAFRQADAYVFQTGMAQEYYGDTIKRKSVIIPNPIWPMKRTMPREGNIRKTFVTVGRLDLKQKRQDLLIEAFNIISPKYPEFKLEIFGDGEDEDKVRALSLSNPNILLKGKTTNIVSSIQNACAYILSSDFEGIPNALLEAMSLGIPSISTDCSPGGAAMLISNYKNGILTPRGDVRALAAAMEYIINNPQKAEEMGNAGKEVNNTYAEQVIIDKWLDLISIL